MRSPMAVITPVRAAVKIIGSRPIKHTKLVFGNILNIGQTTSSR